MAGKGKVAGLVLLAAAALAWGWQWLEFQAYIRSHQREERRHGEVLLKALAGAIHQEARRGRYHPELFAELLERQLAELGGSRLRLEGEGGRVLFAAGPPGDPGGEGSAFLRLEAPFHPRSPQGAGQGPPAGPGGSWRQPGWVEFPAGPLRLLLEYPLAHYRECLARGRARFLLTGGALTAALLFVHLALAGRRRAAGLSSELAAARERIRSSEFLGRLGAGLAHETKNPLGAVRGFARLLARGELPEGEARQAAARILEETDRTVARLDEFLLLSRPPRPRPVPFLLRDLLTDLAGLVGPELQGKGARLAVAGDEMPVQADQEQVRRIFLNLLVNAAAAVGGGGSVWIGLDGEARRVVVDDDGPGVPEEIRETLFEPYVTGRPGGTGLGLAIARRIARAHGWELRYEPRPGGGARFILEVPAA